MSVSQASIFPVSQRYRPAIALSFRACSSKEKTPTRHHPPSTTPSPSAPAPYKPCPAIKLMTGCRGQNGAQYIGSLTTVCGPSHATFLSPASVRRTLAPLAHGGGGDRWSAGRELSARRTDRRERERERAKDVEMDPKTGDPNLGRRYANPSVWTHFLPPTRERQPVRSQQHYRKAAAQSGSPQSFLSTYTKTDRQTGRQDPPKPGPFLFRNRTEQDPGAA
ncbi:hypothetical protein HO133_001442 [Letharia lupina]|uniref:Uncharacterized protein n=1 Tax=Letharia lupina TaxID=560253 RepID=A0A8H6CFM8_9LECA|nr:uncharacterized protein HO133_001442 [Letharia lupina]KAF6222356.1 hypothetical protein HO133_001442 [Letharia lupina]